MTRNRNRKDKIRRSQQLTGVRHAAAARQEADREQHRSQIHDLLTEATKAIGNTDPGDVPTMLRRAWTAVCLIGAATEILAGCADTPGDRSRRLLAQRPLAAAVKAMRATPALRGSPSTANPAGGPDDRLAEPAAAVIRDAVIACCDSLQHKMSQTPADVRPPSAARALSTVAGSAHAISGIYQAAVAPESAGRPAASPPGYLPAGTPAELQAAINRHLHDMSAADPHNTAAALESTWYGFSLVSVLGQYCARRDPDAAVLHENALPVLAHIIEVMDAAPSLPPGVHGLGLDISPAVDPAMMMTIARRGIWDLTLAINVLLPETRRHARAEADQLAAQTCTVLAAELADCYQGRLRTFLNPYGRKPVGGSASLRGRPQALGGAGRRDIQEHKTSGRSVLDPDAPAS